MRASRRKFVRNMGAATAVVAFGSAVSRRARAYPLGLEPGLQLWSVKDSLKSDQAGTLSKIGAMGYREVETYALPPSPLEFKKQCEDAGLSIVGGHFTLRSLKDRKMVDGALQLGMQYMIVVLPTLRPLNDKDASPMSGSGSNASYDNISADDYKWNAEQFNLRGAELKRDGLQLGYHNHPIDLRVFGKRSAYEILIESTDPDLVIFEMDCGHMIHAGADPIVYLGKYPKRIQLLHLKDLKAGFVVSSSLGAGEKDTNAELGAGVIDWKALFQVAAHGNIKHYFVEHEGEMAHPPMESIANSLSYLKTLQPSHVKSV
jgi:sugar phosphate isomerase/epimerase